LSIAEDDVDTAFDQLSGRGGHRPAQEQRIPRLDLLVVDEVQILQGIVKTGDMIDDAVSLENIKRGLKIYLE